MQPADRQITKAFRFPKEVYPSWSPRRPWRARNILYRIVMIRNNLRVLEQKLNASDKLSDAHNFDLQQYIARCYGSLTTSDILFKNKDDQFRTDA